jgi:hypothetical protein
LQFPGSDGIKDTQFFFIALLLIAVFVRVALEDMLASSKFEAGSKLFHFKQYSIKDLAGFKECLAMMQLLKCSLSANKSNETNGTFCWFSVKLLRERWVVVHNAQHLAKASFERSSLSHSTRFRSCIPSYDKDTEKMNPIRNCWLKIDITEEGF